ncbi:sensor domain-containing diguanylate cyclase [Erythrobacter aurantius]|uniref:sensor domain-containing diguanylate cyclase n=1 Tax=Erythrobacter aurantius TaxID=2909249 RepID=UPI00207A520A|nr:diguanylate cyclase [Erythrobacter aurantius]
MASPVDLSVPQPDPASIMPLGSDPLLLACGAMALVALAAISRVVSSRRETREVARTARQHGDAMRDFLQTVRMAERLAGIGIWQYDPQTGEQHWSDGMKRLFGIDEDEQFVAGDAETLLFAHDIDLVGEVERNRHQTDPFEFEFELNTPDIPLRGLRVQACNLIGANGEVRSIVGVVRERGESETARKPAHSDIVSGLDAPITALCDPLTGIATRRLVMAELGRRLVDARITEMPLVLVMFDIDHFQRINADRGAAAADTVLRRVAAIAGAQARDSDLLGRVGDSEFAWIVPGASDRMARIMTERLRQAIAATDAKDGTPAVTISVGYSAMKPDDTALSLFARVDGALWEARASGCNRVRMAA